MIIFEKQKIRIKRYVDNSIKCENCNGYSQQFTIFQEYFHLSFILFFPSEIKTASTLCLKCNDTFNEKKFNHYLSITQTPFYLYSWVILIFAACLVGLITDINTKNQTKFFIQNPEIGDIYKINDKEDERNKKQLKVN